MKLMSDRKSVKSISKWRFSVNLMQDPKGVYYVCSENLLTKETKEVSLIDYNMANFIFNARVNSFEGV